MSEAPERIWIEDPQEMVPYFYEESELHEVAAPVSEYTRTDLVRAQIEAAVKRALEGAAEEASVCWMDVVPSPECEDYIRRLVLAQFIDGEK